jgi:hypothetical protein
VEDRCEGEKVIGEWGCDGQRREMEWGTAVGDRVATCRPGIGPYTHMHISGLRKVV